MMLNKIMLVLAVVSLIAGFALIMNGKLFGTVLFLVAVCLGIVALMRMRRAAGYGNDDVGFNGIAGQGRQQSEAQKREK